MAVTVPNYAISEADGELIKDYDRILSNLVIKIKYYK